MTESVDLREFLSGFVAEADDHLRSCRKALVLLDEAARQRRPDAHAVRQMYRGLHTIKGLAAMVGVQAVVDLSHRMESVLRAADQAGGALGADAVDPLLQALDALESRIGAVGRGDTAAAAPAQLLDDLERLEPSAAAAPSLQGLRLTLPRDLASKLTAAERAQIAEGVRKGRRALRIDFVPTAERAGAGQTITTVREALAEAGELVRVLPLARPPSADAPGGLAFALLFLTDVGDEDLTRKPPLSEGLQVEALVEVEEELALCASDEVADPEAGGGRNFVRVDVERLNGAMQSLSALVVTRFKLTRSLGELERAGADVRELRLVADEYTRQLRDMRESILHLRMVPLSDLFERIPLIVRGLRSSTGKVVRVETEGARSELDKSVAERVFPALVHLVRNAVDHGIEHPSDRRARGKPEEGVLRIIVSEPSGDRLRITVSDDGSGVDAGAVARRLGRPVPEDDRGLLELLTQPGLSTREEATTTSGRGLGLDIVQRIVVRELGGELTLSNHPGRGTDFTLRIPLTVSIVDSLSFECGPQTFVAPLGSVEEVLDAADLRVVDAPAPGGQRQRMVETRDGIAPFVELAELFGMQGASPQGKVVVVRREGVPYTFAVDRVLGQQEVVVRPLVDPLVQVPGISGSTDLGDGRPTLVLDLVALGDNLQATRTKGAHP